MFASCQNFCGNAREGNETTSEPDASGLDGQASLHIHGVKTDRGWEADLIPNFLTFLWPKLSEFCVHICESVVQPAVQKALPFGSKKFDFLEKDSHLGDTPINLTRITAIKVPQQLPKGETPMDNIVFRIDMNWDSKIHMSTQFDKVKVSITGVKLSGQLLLEAVGMLGRPPFFQGVRGFFLNSPNLDLEFASTGMALQKMIEVAKAKILEVFAEKVAAMVVAPNAMGVRLDRDADWFKVMRPRPKGLLLLKVIRAEQLIAADLSWLGRKTSDPFVTVRCGATKQRSIKKSQTLNPEWNVTFRMLVVAPHFQNIYMEFWDEDKISEHDFLGRRTFSVEEVVKWGDDEKSFLIEDDKGSTGKAGTVFLSAQWRPILHLDQDSSLSHTKNEVDVFCGIYAASNLPWAVIGTDYWIVATCTQLVPLPNDDAQKPMMSPKRTRKKREVRDSEVTEMKRKLEILRKRNVPAEDMAAVFSMNPNELKECMKGGGEITFEKLREVLTDAFSEMEMNVSYNLLLQELANAKLTLELKCAAPKEKEKSLGTYTMELSELVTLPACSMTRTIEMSGTNNNSEAPLLKVNFQAKFPGDPTNELPTALSRDLTETLQKLPQK